MTKDLIFAQIEAELHALRACTSIPELRSREQAAVRCLEGFPRGNGGTHRYILVLLKSHLRFLEETTGLDATEEVLRLTQTAGNVLRDEISPGMGVLQILAERGRPRRLARATDRQPRCARSWELEDEEN